MKVRHRWRRPLDVVGIEEALREAATLAGDHVEDEPAALLYALMRRPIDLADGWPLLAYLMAENQARNALHAELRLDPSDTEVRAPNAHPRAQPRRARPIRRGARVRPRAHPPRLSAVYYADRSLRATIDAMMGSEPLRRALATTRPGA
jgi:hypothetical protein